jgi:hypothetical protein
MCAGKGGECEFVGTHIIIVQHVATGEVLAWQDYLYCDRCALEEFGDRSYSLADDEGLASEERTERRLEVVRSQKDQGTMAPDKS